MNYIWESMQNEKTEIHFKQAEIFSPYYEIPPEIKKENEHIWTVSYNSLYRFEHIFMPLFSKETPMEPWEEKLFDILTHMLVILELKSGYSQKEYKIKNVMEQIEIGSYGKTIKERYQKLTLMQKHKLACYMVEQSGTRASATLYGKALMGLWNTGVVYKDHLNPKVLLVYAGERKKDELQNILSIVNEIFLPLDYKVRVFWQSHFAVFEKKETLNYENIEIF